MFNLVIFVSFCIFIVIVYNLHQSYLVSLFIFYLSAREGAEPVVETLLSLCRDGSRAVSIDAVLRALRLILNWFSPFGKYFMFINNN